MNFGYRVRRFNLIAFALICVVAIIGGMLGGTSATRAQGTDTTAPPSLTDVSNPGQPDRFSVAGGGFTPGGDVYLAIYDQMGRVLYEHRNVTASERRIAAISNDRNDNAVELLGGRIRESLSGLCGASAMMRAFDEASERWSNWLTVQPGCSDGSTSAVVNDLNVSPRLPASSPSNTAGQGGAQIALSVDESHQALGSVTVRGQGFTPGRRVYLAIYDQRGAALYPTRWVVADSAVYGPGGSVDPATGYRQGGALLESFTGLCGAQVMVRAFDMGTETWSGWVNVSVSC